MHSEAKKAVMRQLRKAALDSGTEAELSEETTETAINVAFSVPVVATPGPL